MSQVVRRTGPRSLREQCDKCRHFTGIGSNADGSRRDILKDKGRGSCRANVKYDDVIKKGARMIALPCFHPEPDNMPADGVWPTCPHQSFKTADELDAEAAEIERVSDEFIQRITIVRPAILKHAGWITHPRDGHEIPVGEQGVKRNGAKGFFDCPICKTGKLAYTISGYNGHVWAKCTTDNCVSWME